MSLGLVGSRLGKYEILDEIGQGGMSVVYRARDTHLERLVAIKVMHAFLAEQPEARARFHREAVAVARLKHPHIIEILDYSGRDAAQSYIVMEIVDGEALSARLANGPFQPPEGALVIGRAVADALAHAHAQGVIHRDLKPENILVGKNGSIKLTDFGIARMLDNQTLTMTGTLLGSPAYMAPEYIDGQQTDARADIFSFGAMMYQFVTGRLPFEAASPHGLLKKIVAGEYTPAEQRNPKTHATLARLLARCLARDPAARFPSAGELLAALDAQLTRLELDPARDRERLLTTPGYGVELERALVPRYVTLGKSALARRRIGAALEDFDRVLSIEPHHREVRRIVDRLSRRALAMRSARDAALVVLGTAVVTLGGATLLEYTGGSSPKQRSAADTTSTATTPLKNVTFVIPTPGDLYIDGNLVAPSAEDALPRELAPGEHVARLVDGSREVTTRFTVPERGPAPPVKLDLGPLTTAANGSATPTKSPPPRRVEPKLVTFRIAGGLWVNVHIDDVLSVKEKTNPVQLWLTPGTHRIRFSNPCCEPAEIALQVSENEPTPEPEAIELKPAPARLYIDGAPPLSRVEVAGRLQILRPGEPVFVPMTSRGPARHEVVVTKDDEVILRELASFEPGKEQRLAVKHNPL